MAVGSRRAEVAEYTTPEEAFDVEGAVGVVHREVFEEHLRSPEVQQRLERARTLWRRMHGRDPVSRIVG
jgi:hypothetical protein